jgi:hypothetical protein
LIAPAAQAGVLFGEAPHPFQRLVQRTGQRGEFGFDGIGGGIRGENISGC